MTNFINTFQSAALLILGALPILALTATHGVTFF
jgi:hypothetical protein